MALLATEACSGGVGSSNNPNPSVQVDYSGSYFTTINEPMYRLVLSQNGTDVRWTLSANLKQGSTTNFSGTGVVTGDTLTLPATSSDFNMRITFKDKLSFTGAWSYPSGGASGSITGSSNPWPTYDVTSFGVPQIASSDYIELSKIASISYFRSSAGHDYSDDFESCRSMKHYFIPKSTIDPAQIAITSPIDGTVVGYINEWAGTQIAIRSITNPAMTFIIFHVNLAKQPSVGDVVSLGQVLGTHIGSQTGSDIAVGVNTPAGFQLVSYLQTLSNSQFAGYIPRGVLSPGNLIYTKAQRDADPLTCDGETFTTIGTLPQYFILK